MAWFRWSPRPGDDDHPCARECHTMDTVNGQVFVYGGNDTRRRFGEVHKLDCGTTAQELPPERFPEAMANDFDIFGADTMVWTRPDVLGDVPKRRTAHSSAVYEDKIVIFGGWDGMEELGDLYTFQTRRCLWEKVETNGAAPTPRHFHASAVVGDTFVVFGGYDGAQWRNDLSVLDLRSLRWTPLKFDGVAAALSRRGESVPAVFVPGPRASGSIVSLEDGRVLLFGGYDGNSFLDDLWVLHTPESSSAAKTQRRRGGNSSGSGSRGGGESGREAAHKGVLAESGDVDESGGLYSAVREAPKGMPEVNGYWWERVWPRRARGAPPPEGGTSVAAAAGSGTHWPGARSGHAMVRIGKFVLLIGGRHKRGRHNDVHALNLDTMEWREIPTSGRPPEQRKTHAAVPLGDRVFLFGGHDGTDWLGDFFLLECKAALKALLPQASTAGVPLITPPTPSLDRDLARILPLGSDGAFVRLCHLAGVTVDWDDEEDQGRPRLTEKPVFVVASDTPMKSSSSKGGDKDKEGARGSSPTGWAKKSKDATSSSSSSSAAAPPPPQNQSSTSSSSAAAAVPVSSSSFSSAAAASIPPESSSEEMGTPEPKTRIAKMAGKAASPLTEALDDLRLPLELAEELEQGASDACPPDVWFRLQGVRVGLHRCILAARSSFYRDMFSSGMYEATSREIDLPDTTLPVFLAAVRFMYTCRLPPRSVEGALVPDLLAHAQMVGLKELSLSCQSRLQEALNVRTAADILDLADTHGALPLRRAALGFILRNYAQVNTSIGFVRLRADLLREVLFRNARLRSEDKDLDWSTVLDIDPDHDHDHHDDHHQKTSFSKPPATSSSSSSSAVPQPPDVDIPASPRALSDRMSVTSDALRNEIGVDYPGMRTAGSKRERPAESAQEQDNSSSPQSSSSQPAPKQRKQ